MDNKNCIIIPAFNEEKNIVSVIENIKKFCNYDIIVIDDGSKDLTCKKAQQSGAYVIRHPFNMGYGVALQTGYKYALEKNYDFIVQIDGDGQHNPKYIPILFIEIENNKADVVIGSRFLENNNYDAGFLKMSAIKLFRKIIYLMNGQNITDPTSGYQGLNRKAFMFFNEDTFPCDYPDANIIVLLHKKGFKIKEIPVEMVINSECRSMHKGILNITYYFFRVFLSIFITFLTKKS